MSIPARGTPEWASLPMAEKVSMANRGTMNGCAKLRPQDVLAIRADPRLHREIAPDYGIHKSHVAKLKGRQNWKHLP